MFHTDAEPFERLVKKYSVDGFVKSAFQISSKLPIYIYDETNVISAVNELRNSFISSCENTVSFYYSIKVNPHPMILKTVNKMGLGVEVASTTELKIALQHGFKRIIFYAPGKIRDDFECAYENRNTTILHVDSIGEINRLSEFLSNREDGMEVGLRFHTQKNSGWDRYGVSASELKLAVKIIENDSKLKLIGLHHHVSRNVNTISYIDAINTIKTLFEECGRPKTLKYIDLGGGFEAKEPEGRFAEGHFPLSSFNGLLPSIKLYRHPTIGEYASSIMKEIAKCRNIFRNLEVIFEPGRYIANSAMHILMSVTDIKCNAAVLNGGVNLVGWQRFEYEYFPVINITNPSTHQSAFALYGNLCTTYDIWGYSYYGTKIEHGDKILIPNQGALTYSLAQNFIHPIASVEKIME